jgi:hypothetical protein
MCPNFFQKYFELALVYCIFFSETFNERHIINIILIIPPKFLFTIAILNSCLKISKSLLLYIHTIRIANLAYKDHTYSARLTVRDRNRFLRNLKILTRIFRTVCVLCIQYTSSCQHLFFMILHMCRKYRFFASLNNEAFS